VKDADNGKEGSARSRRKIGIGMKHDTNRKPGRNEPEKISGSLGLMFLKCFLERLLVPDKT